MKQLLSCPVLTLILLLSLSVSAVQGSEVPVVSENTQQYRQWVVDMKAAERGPFTRIHWFCKDGRILPPKSYACGDVGGRQHGQWSPHTLELRDKGYKIANIRAAIDAPTLIAEPDFNDTLNQILIEKYLIAADDGWILRRAMFYRGALH